MPTSIANITWDFVPGSLSTLVEYKVSTDSTWISPASPTNPTPTNVYPILINNSVEYDVRLTTNGLACGPQSITLQIMNGGATCCPATYTPAPDGTYCYKYNDIAATPPSGALNSVATTNAQYTVWGSLIYDSGYGINGTGTFTQIPYTNTFWVNGAGYPTGAGATAGNGPLNRTGLWASVTTSNQDVGFSVCVNSPTSGTYYIGTGVDNYTTLKVDGVTVLQMDQTAIGTYLATHGYAGVGVESTFRFWHIYPVTLTSGPHVLEIIAHNDTVFASLGAEVYNATSSEISAATSYVDLGAKLLFSTKDYIGQPIQIGSGGIGYSCPVGYSLVLCSGPAFCRQTLTTPTISC